MAIRFCIFGKGQVYPKDSWGKENGKGIVHWFLTRGDFTLQETLGNVKEHFGLSQLGKEGDDIGL